MSFNVGPLQIGLINAWFNFAGSKHNLTFPFALGTNTKLLHHSTVSSTPSGVIISSFIASPTHPSMVFVVHMLGISVALDRACYKA